MADALKNRARRSRSVRIVQAPVDDIYEVHLDSSTGISLSNSKWRSHLRFHLAQSIKLKAGRNRFQVAVVGGVIPRSTHMVDDYNNTFSLIVGATTHEIVMEHGNYTANNFKAQVAADILAESGLTMNIAYSTVTNKYTFTLANAAYSGVSFAFGDSDAYKLMGLSSGTHAFNLVGGTWTLTSDNVVNMQTLSSVSVHLEGTSFDASLTPAGTSSILRVCTSPNQSTQWK